MTTRAQNARYDASPKGRARNKKYRDTVKGIAQRFKSGIASDAKRRGTR